MSDIINSDESMMKILCNNKESNKIESILLSKQKRKVHLPKIKKASHFLSEIVRKKINEGDSIFLTTKRKNNSIMKKRNKNLKIIKSYAEKSGFNEINDYNVFNNEDNFIQDLMKKFYQKSQKQIPVIERRKLAFNKLYDITPEENERIKKAKHKKFLSLEEYQTNVMTALSPGSISRRKMMDLAQNLNELKLDVDSMKPLPKINIDIIYDHVYSKNNSKSLKKMSIRDIISRQDLPKDQYEKEERLIKSIKNFKVIPKKKRNKNLDCMPLYIRTLFSK